MSSSDSRRRRAHRRNLDRRQVNDEQLRHHARFEDACGQRTRQEAEIRALMGAPGRWTDPGRREPKPVLGPPRRPGFSPIITDPVHPIAPGRTADHDQKILPAATGLGRLPAPREPLKQPMSRWERQEAEVRMSASPRPRLRQRRRDMLAALKYVDGLTRGQARSAHFQRLATYRDRFGGALDRRDGELHRLQKTGVIDFRQRYRLILDEIQLRLSAERDAASLASAPNATSPCESVHVEDYPLDDPSVTRRVTVTNARRSRRPALD